MAYDPTTGAWKYDTSDATGDSVEGRVQGLVDTNSPLIQQARTQGVEASNRRGLINSSISAGAAQDAAYKAAVPIATADANTVAAKNLSAQGAEQQLEQGKQTIQGQKDIQAQSDTAANARLLEQLGSQEAVAAAERAAAKERLGMQLTSQEKVAADQYTNAMNIAKLQSDTSIKTTGLTIEGNSLNTDKTIEANKAINQATINSQTAQWVVTATTNARSNYNSIVNNITANPNIGAADRARMLDDAKKTYDADMLVISGVSNVKLNYTPPTTGNGDAATPGGAPKPSLLSYQGLNEDGTSKAPPIPPTPPYVGGQQ